MALVIRILQPGDHRLLGAQFIRQFSLRKPGLRPGGVNELGNGGVDPCFFNEPPPFRTSPAIRSKMATASDVFLISVFALI